MFIVTCKTDDDVWSYGPFETMELAQRFADNAGAKFTGIDYEPVEMLNPQMMYDDISA